MRIGLTARGTTANQLVEHAQWAEEQGFTSVWYASVTAGDPLVAMALAGRATSRIELGTAVLQTYPCHPVLQANRVASVVDAMGRPGFTLGIGPSHEKWVTMLYGMSFDHPARSTEEYVRILTALLRGEGVDFDGEDWSSHAPTGVTAAHAVPVLVSAMGPRLVKLAGAVADGTITYLVSPKLLDSRIVPQLNEAATAAGRSAPRIVAGLPVAVHDDLAEAREAGNRYSAMFGGLPIYKRVMNEGGYQSFGDIALVGNERSVGGQLQAIFDAGATDVWAGVFPVGDDPARSVRRTTDLLATLL
jgi:F420-dependent oxidoreductase-like protein